jgi:hypothetical protein
MEALDTLILSRIQFAANISFHILFPTITIALGWVLFFFRVRFAQTGDDKWMASYRFWVKVFALLRHGRRVGHHHVLPVRHQLAGLHGNRGQHRGAASGL